MCPLLDFNPSEFCRIYWQMEQIHILNPLAYWIIIFSGVVLALGLLKSMTGSAKKRQPHD
jgi:hypothetical protein